MSRPANSEPTQLLAFTLVAAPGLLVLAVLVALGALDRRFGPAGALDHPAAAWQAAV